MSRRPLLAALLGVVALGVAVTTEVTLPVEALVDRFGSDYDYLVVVAVAALFGLLSLPVLESGRAANLDQTETPDPERPATAPPAGRRLEERRTSLAVALPVVGRVRRARLQDRLRRMTVGALTRSAPCGRKTARERVERGDWSDDPVASTFLAEGRRLSPRAVVGGFRHAEPPHGYATRRVLEEIAALERERST